MAFNNHYALATLTLAITTLLSGCFGGPHRGFTSPEELNVQICQHIKQDIAQNDSNVNMTQQGNSPTTAATLYKEYQAHNCEELIDGPGED